MVICLLSFSDLFIALNYFNIYERIWWMIAIIHSLCIMCQHQHVWYVFDAVETIPKNNMHLNCSKNCDAAMIPPNYDIFYVMYWYCRWIKTGMTQWINTQKDVISEHLHITYLSIIMNRIVDFWTFFFFCYFISFLNGWQMNSRICIVPRVVNWNMNTDSNIFSDVLILISRGWHCESRKM